MQNNGTKARPRSGAIEREREREECAGLNVVQGGDVCRASRKVTGHRWCTQGGQIGLKSTGDTRKWLAKAICMSADSDVSREVIGARIGRRYGKMRPV
jgi:hypothetical protein